MEKGSKRSYEAPKLERIEGAAAKVVGHLLNQSEDLKKKNVELERLSTIDALTGIANRRGFDEAVRRMIAAIPPKGIDKNREREYALHRLAIMVVDIDHFKKFNDEYGHAVGDEVLRAVAKNLVEHVREVDLVARWGGEEFIMAFPGADTERILAKFGERKGEKETPARMEVSVAVDGKTYNIQVSGGVAEYQPGEDFQSTFNRADKALYLAKRTGRNRIVGY